MAERRIDFLVRRDDLRRCRFEEGAAPAPSAGEALFEVEAFGLTANNVTYAVMGERMSYWDFFPAPEGWGRVPVWGFARVAASAHEQLEEGTRVFGYLPPSTHLVVTPDGIDARGFRDGAAHRAKLPSVYNEYVRANGDPGRDRRWEDQQILFRPLFATSFLVDDFLAENEFFGAGTMVLSSASSKTALGTAFLLARRGPVELVGLTSAARTGFVESVEVYDRVLPYDAVESLPRQPAVYVDFSGDAELRGAVHRRYGESLGHDCVVGASHWDRLGSPAEGLPGPAPEFLFAPDRIRKRNADWGPEEVQLRIRDAWAPFGQWLSGWLTVVHGSEPEDVERAYLELLEGRADPSSGYVMTLLESLPGMRGTADALLRKVRQG